MKPPAAEPQLLSHTGRAVVFSSYDDMSRRIDDPALDVDEVAFLLDTRARTRSSVPFASALWLASLLRQEAAYLASLIQKSRE